MYGIWVHNIRDCRLHIALSYKATAMNVVTVQIFEVVLSSSVEFNSIHDY